MIEFSQSKNNGLTRISSQPIVLGAAIFVLLVAAAASIAVWRSYTGTSPESDRVVAVRQLQARTAQASEQLVEKTKGLEATQQESIDQLQVVQDQLQTVRRLLAAQQTETKKLSEQVGSLTGAIDSLRQSFASTQTSEPSTPPSVRKKPAKRQATSQRKRAKSRG
jgi:septal ring factor EnvC (AmiA/AmiB activator)